MSDEMYQDLDERPAANTSAMDKWVSGGILASIGGAFVWMVNNSEKIQMTFENPLFMVLMFILMMIIGGLVVYLLYSRPMLRRESAYKKSLRAAVLHAQQCDVELAQIKAEFATVAKFIEGYKPSFTENEAPNES